MAKKTKKRYGVVCLRNRYVVDMDNRDMIGEAKECLYEDLMNAVKYDELGANIDVIEDKTVNEADIPDFLKDINNG
jgi:hypothetical protein